MTELSKATCQNIGDLCRNKKAPKDASAGCSSDEFIYTALYLPATYEYKYKQYVPLLYALYGSPGTGTIGKQSGPVLFQLRSVSESKGEKRQGQGDVTGPY